MSTEEFLSIGSFALLSGLSMSALRHYDETGVLTPAYVDDRINYRYYLPDQVRIGRTIRALRAIDLPIEEIRQVLEAGNEEVVRSVLLGHRERLAERTQVLKEMIESLDRYIEKRVIMQEVRGSRIALVNIGVKDLENSRRFYENTFGVPVPTHLGMMLSQEHLRSTEQEPTSKSPAFCCKPRTHTRCNHARISTVRTFWAFANAIWRSSPDTRREHLNSTSAATWRMSKVRASVLVA